MNRFLTCALAAVCIAPFAARAEGEAIAVAELVFAIDTTGAAPSVKSAADVPVPISYPKGHSVTVISPDGVESGLEGVDGLCRWSPNTGGIWTLIDSHAGSVLLSVRHSVTGTQGSGTVASPAKIVDEDELIDLVAGSPVTNGYVFAMCGDLAPGDVEWPAGYAVLPAGDGLWQLAETPDGLLYASPEANCIVQTDTPGPDRQVQKGNPIPPVAWSDDGWTGYGIGGCTLSFVSPKGVTAREETLVDDGALAFVPNETGLWTITLTHGGEASVARVRYLDPALIISIY